MLPNGRQAVFVNRVNWAVICMDSAGLPERVRRGGADVRGFHARQVACGRV